MHRFRLSRRPLARGVAAALTLLAAGCGGDDDSSATETPPTTEPVEMRSLTVQMDWTPSNADVGEMLAIELGYFADEGLDVALRAGGPDVDVVQAVANGTAEIGRSSSSPTMLIAVSQGIPIKAFAVAIPEHPYAYFSRPDDPVESADDMMGKSIGIPQSGETLLNAALAANDVDPSDVSIVGTGGDVLPLVNGQVDFVAGWTTNVAQRAPLGSDVVTLRLWDLGVHLYARPYFAEAAFVDDEPAVLEGFVRALAKGWIYAKDHPDEAIDLLMEQYPDLDRANEEAGLAALLEASFPASTATTGWGAMDAATWESQITQWEGLGQFEADAPSVDSVMTTAILDATADARQVSAS
jgi:NitT/TauT family transport system substrate-binding protein